MSQPNSLFPVQPGPCTGLFAVRPPVLCVPILKSSRFVGVPQSCLSVMTSPKELGGFGTVDAKGPDARLVCESFLVSRMPTVGRRYAILRDGDR